MFMKHERAKRANVLLILKCRLQNTRYVRPKNQSVSLYVNLFQPYFQFLKALDFVYSSACVEKKETSPFIDWSKFQILSQLAVELTKSICILVYLLKNEQVYEIRNRMGATISPTLLSQYLMYHAVTISRPWCQNISRDIMTAGLANQGVTISLTMVPEYLQIL